MSKEEVTVKTFVPLKKEAPSFTKLTNLASNRLGAKTLGCSDDFFAEVSNILKPEPPIFKPDAYTDRGKWMDGILLFLFHLLLKVGNREEIVLEKMIFVSLNWEQQVKFMVLI